MPTGERQHVARAVAGADPSGSGLPWFFATCTCGWSKGKKANGARVRIYAAVWADRHWLTEHAGIQGYG